MKNEDIVLQETNWKEGVMNDFKKRWNGGILYKNGDGKLGRGVPSLMREELFKLSKIIYKDRVGKCIAIEMRHEGK